MKKINIASVPEDSWTSPKGVFANSSRCISIALGRDPDSTDLLKRHPFDVEICRIPAGKRHCPYHSHSAQWEYYQVISGTGSVRDPSGLTQIGEGDAFLFGPGEAHQIINNGAADLVLTIVADNPLGESCHYPDSGKWMVRSPGKSLIRSESLAYLDGEE